MRYLLILALVAPAACTILPEKLGGRANQPETAADSSTESGTESSMELPPETDPEPGADPEQTGQADLSDIVPNERDGRPGGTGLLTTTRTVAGLGDPGRPGLWLETPLVQARGPGRIRLASGGAYVQVTLLPATGTASSGSRLSLQAMRNLGAPLTELVELEVSPAG